MVLLELDLSLPPPTIFVVPLKIERGWGMALCQNYHLKKKKKIAAPHDDLDSLIPSKPIFKFSLDRIDVDR